MCLSASGLQEEIKRIYSNLLLGSRIQLNFKDKSCHYALKIILGNYYGWLEQIPVERPNYRPPCRIVTCQQ